MTFESNRQQNITAKVRLNRRAFTAIELLTVVGILGMLTAMAVIGFKVVGGASKSRLTEVALENCKSLLATYKETSSVNTLIDEGTVEAMTSTPTFRWRTTVNSTATPRTIENSVAIAPGAILPNGDVEASSDNRAVRARYLRDETARVIRRLMAVPANKKSIESMPPDHVVRVRVPVDPSQVLPPGGSEPEYARTPVNAYFDSVNLVDGSGQPIYFIPGGGLRFVNVDYKGSGDKADKNNYERQVTIRAPDNGPFWASPGPDGDLTAGDDNLYSFGRN